MAIVQGLLREGAVRSWSNSIVDAGANTGVETCHYASAAPAHTVYALDPSLANVALIRDDAARRRQPNVQPVHGGLGDKSGRFHIKTSTTKVGRQIDTTERRILDAFVPTDRVPSPSSANSGDAEGNGFTVYTLDGLFLPPHGALAGRGARLGLVHLDVEGREADVLRGGMRVIARDRPILTVELLPQSRGMRNNSKRAFDLLRDLGYAAFVVDEQCGRSVDCRNVLGLPRERLDELRAHSNTMQLASAASAGFYADSFDDFDHAVVLPCGGRFGGTPGRDGGCTRQRQQISQLIDAILTDARTASAATNLSQSWLISRLPVVGRRGYKRTMHALKAMHAGGRGNRTEPAAYKS